MTDRAIPVVLEEQKHSSKKKRDVKCKGEELQPTYDLLPFAVEVIVRQKHA